ncbi:MAG TPA: response regulator [Kiritimatiellae bacterium]|nr:response regulator [Kiritimatiellia bacterium]
MPEGAAGAVRLAEVNARSRNLEELRKRRDEMLRSACPLLESGQAKVTPEVAALLRICSPLGEGIGARSALGKLASRLSQRLPQIEKERLWAQIGALERICGGELEAEAAWSSFVEYFRAVRVRGRLRHCLTLGPVLKEALDPATISGARKDAELQDLISRVQPVGPEQLQWLRNLADLVGQMLDYLLLQDLRAREALQEMGKSARVRAVGEMATGVAHHFNNILSVVLGYTTFVLNKEELPAEIAGPLERVIEAAMRGRRLTSELLKFAVTGVEEEAAVKVQDVFDTVLSLLGTQAGGAVKVEANYGAQNDQVEARAGVIHKLVYNLLAAAFESMPEGGRLKVETANVSMDTEYGMQTFLKIAVTDTGGFVPQDTGGAAELLGGASTTFLLSDVYGIVGTLEGTISVSSRPGKETRVEVLLPVIEGERGGRALGAGARRGVVSRKSVWVIDDDPRFREMCRVVLGEAGYEVHEYADGITALHEIEAGRHGDILLVDYSMPEINGQEFCQRLDQLRVRVPVIVVSGLSAETPGVRQLLGRRSTFYLQKPFASRELLDTLSVASGETVAGVDPLG